MSTITLESLCAESGSAAGVTLAIEIKPGAYGRHTAELWARDTAREISAASQRRERQAAGWAWLAARRWLEKTPLDPARPRPRAVLCPYDEAAVLVERLPESLIRELGSLVDALHAMGFTVQLPGAGAVR